jgi:hypothetical protein
MGGVGIVLFFFVPLLLGQILFYTSDITVHLFFLAVICPLLWLGISIPVSLTVAKPNKLTEEQKTVYERRFKQFTIAILITLVLLIVLLFLSV